MIALVVLSVAFSTFAVPALADVTQSDIRTAEATAQEAAARLRDARGELSAAERRLERMLESLESVAEQLDTQDVRIVEERTEARERIARMYMSAGGSDTAGLLGLSRITDLPAHIAYLTALSDQDREFVNTLAATRAELERLSTFIEGSVQDQEQVIDGLSEDVAAREAELAAARAEVSAVEAEWQRQEQERIARAEAERRRQEQEEQRRREEEERKRREEEERKAQALAAMQSAASQASSAGWTPGAGVAPWRPLVEKYFPPEVVDDALSVMMCESLGNPLAINKYSAASGLFQHLPYYWPSRSTKAGWAGADIFDPEANIAVAAWLVERTITVEQREPWGHWVCKP